MDSTLCWSAVLIWVCLLYTSSIKKYKEAVLVDLPGIYSLSPYTAEEVVTRDFLVKEHPDAIINIVDATNPVSYTHLIYSSRIEEKDLVVFSIR